MSMIDRLASVSDPLMYDGDLTQENFLRQLVFTAIQDYIEEHLEPLAEWIDAALAGGDEIEMPDPLWVDEYGDRGPGELDGLERVVAAHGGV